MVITLKGRTCIDDIDHRIGTEVLLLMLAVV